MRELSIAFFKEIFRRVLRSLQFHDKLMFAARLSLIFMAGENIHGLEGREWDALLRDSVTLSASSVDADTVSKIKTALSVTSLDNSVYNHLLALSNLAAFADLPNDMITHASEWRSWMTAMEPESESHMPDGWLSSGDKTAHSARATLLKMIVLKVLRPDRLVAAVDVLVHDVFGSSFNWRQFAEFDLQEIVEYDSQNTIPIMLCSEAGHGQDTSGNIDSLSQVSSKVLLQVAMGSAEGYTDADRCLSQVPTLRPRSCILIFIFSTYDENIDILYSYNKAAKLGQWVLLRNTHLCTEWLEKLAKKLYSMSPHESFRLFLTCEITPLLPSTLLRMSDIVYIEESTGIKANLTRFFKGISQVRFEKPPVERSRLYMLLAWLHAIVHERLRYVPMGWSKRYEFNEADSVCAMDVIDQWVDQVAQGKVRVFTIIVYIQI